jgi:hypothetical protein
MKRLVKVNSEMRGGNREKAKSQRGLSSRERFLNEGNSGTLLHDSSMLNRLLPCQSFNNLLKIFLCRMLKNAQIQGARNPEE